MICGIFLWMGVAFLVYGLFLIYGLQLALIALVAGLILWIILSILRRLFAQLGGLPLWVIEILVAIAIVVVVLSETHRGSEHLVPAVFIASATCFIIYGLCISAPSRQSTSPDKG